MKYDSRRNDEDNSNERWLISYADFITLMFAFFVILYATSDRDLKKAKEFQNSVDKFLVKAGAFGESGAKVEQGEKNFSVIEPQIQTFRPSKPENLTMLNGLEAAIESKLSEKERKKYLIDIAPEERGVRLTLAAKQLYGEHDSAKFSQEAVPFVDHLGQIIKEQKKRMMIEGYVASGQHGAFASSWELAAARSINLLRYFQQKQGFAEKALAASTYGSSRPLAQAEAAKENARIELLVLYDDGEF